MVPLQQTGRGWGGGEDKPVCMKEQPSVSLQQMSALVPGKQEEEEQKISYNLIVLS